MNYIIIKALLNPEKKLLDWVPPDKIVWSTLSKNPNAVSMFTGNEDKIVFERAVKLEGAIGFIEKNLHRLSDKAWENLNRNAKAIDILKRNPERINVRQLCKNTNCLPLLKQHIEQKGMHDVDIDFISLHLNPAAIDLINRQYDTNRNSCFIIEPYIELMLGNPRMMEIDIIKENLEYLLEMNVDVSSLFGNKNKELRDIILDNVGIAVEQKRYRSMSECIFAEQIYIDKLKIFNDKGELIDPDREHMVSWRHISENEHAIRIIESNLDRVDWRFVSMNPAAIHILERNIDMVNWTFLSLNPSIFEETYNNHITRFCPLIDKILA